jgi:hypothetical protein
VSIKYDGEFPGIGHQFTPQSGEFKGRTFTSKELSVESARDKMVEQFKLPADRVIKDDPNFQQKLNSMQAEVESTKTSGVSYDIPTMEKNADHGTVRYSSDSPQWMRDLSDEWVKAGTPALKRKDLVSLINAIRTGKKDLGSNQEKRMASTLKAIDEYAGDSNEFGSYDNITALEKRGFDILGEQSIVIEESELDDGVVSTGKVDGQYDEWTVTGINDDLTVTFIGKERGKAFANFTDSVIIEAIKYGNVDGKNIVEEQGSLFNKKEELFSGGKEIVKPKLQKSKKKKSKTDKLQGDLFTGMPTKEDQLSLFAAKPGAKPGDGSELSKSNNQRLVEVGVKTTGNILSNGLAVESPADVAALFSNLIKDPQENLYTVTVDSAGNILEIHKYSKGGKGSSVAVPSEMAGRVYKVDGASKSYFVHNHPGGSTQPSPSDIRTSKSLGAILRLRGINSEGLIIGRDNGKAIFGEIDFGGKPKPITEGIKRR